MCRDHFNFQRGPTKFAPDVLKSTWVLQIHPGLRYTRISSSPDDLSRDPGLRWDAIFGMVAGLVLREVFLIHRPLSGLIIVSS